MAFPMFSGAIAPPTRTSGCSSSAADIRPPTSCSISPGLPNAICATSSIWAVRAADLSRVFGGGGADQLPARGKLGSDLRHLVDSGRLELALGFGVERIDRRRRRARGRSSARRNPRVLGPVDRIIVCTGQRPDLAMTRELRLDLDPWLESARTLGPLIDPNLHSCGTVPPHGYKELAHPEPGYFAVGIKSYGRAPTFLMATGYEQVRSVAAHLAGDEAAATMFGSCCRKPASALLISCRQPMPAAGCCGGPAPAGVDACCVKDAEAKASWRARLRLRLQHETETAGRHS